MEAESSDSLNQVEVTGIVTSTLLSSHLNAIGVHVTGWDIEASNAQDSFFGQNGGSDAENSVVVIGTINGIPLNVDYAPGQGSYGVLVADDLQAEDAYAAAGDSGDGGFGTYNVAVSAIARNTISATGVVAGSAIDSYGVRVDGEVHATFARALITVDNYFGAENQASGYGRALNVVSIEGAVGGEGAANNSVGFYVAGDVYANDARVDGGTFISIPQLFVGGPAASVYSSGVATLDVLAGNTVSIAGSVGADGGADGAGVYVGGSVFARDAQVLGQALSDGGQYETSLAYGVAVARNVVGLAGTVSSPSGAATGIVIEGDVYANSSGAFGEGIARFGNFYDQIGGDSTSADFTAIAGNAVSISGVASSEGGAGVAIGGDVYASEGSAGAFAGANPYDFDNEFALSALAVAQASNSVSISGIATADDAIGVAIGEGVFANQAYSQAYATSYGNFTYIVDGPVHAVDAQSSVVSAASNAIAILGVVGDSVSNAAGVDPVFISSNSAYAYGDALADTYSNDGLGATSNAATSIAATNVVGLTGSIGNAASGSTGIYVDTYVSAYDANADGYATAYATAVNTGTLSTAGASATATNSVEAANVIGIAAVVGDTVTGSTGVYVGGSVQAFDADVFASTFASAYVSGGGAADAAATATATVNASNLALVGVTIGAGASETTGVFIGEGVSANLAFAEGIATATASNYSLDGDATATTGQTVSASNGVGLSVVLGLGAVTSTGITIGDDVEAFASFAEGEANARAYVDSSGAGIGNAVATVNNSVSARNGASASVAFGGSNSVVGLHIDGDLFAYDADAVAFAEGSASVFSGVGNATALVGNLATAGNEAIAVATLAGGDTLSAGVWIGEGIGAIDAFATGLAEGYASVTDGTGAALATANNSVAAYNAAGAIGVVGVGSTASTGVYVGAGIVAMQAEAEGDALVQATTSGASVGNATATAIGSIAAGNAVTIAGTAAADGQGNTGVFVEGPGFYDLPFVGVVPIGAGALGALAEGGSFATANVNGGAGNAQATASMAATASNTVVIGGTVGTGTDGSYGVVINDGPVLAVAAQAFGTAVSSALKENGAGDATAASGGSAAAGNIILMTGLVGTLSTDSTGVAVNNGPVIAALAEGAATYIAGATRNGAENGNATATVGTTVTPASASATNLISIVGFVPQVSSLGDSALENTGIYISDDVLALGVLGEGTFSATANRNDGGTGTATASAYGDVLAVNGVSIVGTVAPGGSLADERTYSHGVLIGGDLAAAGAFAQGTANVTAGRGGDGATGSALATVELEVTASNQVVLVGSVGSYNDFSTGIGIGGDVSAVFAFAEGSAGSFASNTDGADGAATASASIGVSGSNLIVIAGDSGVTNSSANSSDGVNIVGGVTARNASAESFVSSTAQRLGAGDGTATATANSDTEASNVIIITGAVGPNFNDFSIGVFIGEGVSASIANAQGAAVATADHTGTGTGTAVAAALDLSQASNLVSIVGSVDVDSWDAFGVDPLFVNASDATASSSATASANGPAGSTATATATAEATNSIVLAGTVAGSPTLSNIGSTGVYVANDVTALNASASASTTVTTDGAATGTSTTTASALNLVSIAGTVGVNGSGNAGVWIGGDVVLGGLALDVGTTINALNGTTITATATGTLSNVALVTGVLGDGQTNSDGVYIGGGLLFGGDVNTTLTLTINSSGGGVGNAQQVIEGMNIGVIAGTVGVNSAGSHGVHIEGNVEVTNSLVSNFVIVGVDATNDGTTRGVWIGGSVLTGDAEDSQISAQSANLLSPLPQQIGDYVELAGSVFIGANGGLNPYGVAVGGGNDFVLVRNTHFQMEVVNGFDGGSNPDEFGQDVLRFDNAQLFVSNIDNFEIVNVFNRSMVILTNPTPYTYAVRDEVNIAGSAILSFGDGGAPPPPPIANGAPVNSLQLDTGTLTIGGIAGVKTVVPVTDPPTVDDSILKAENNGTGTYVINAEVFNFGTITLSKVLSTIRGSDPHGLLSSSANSFDEAAEQQYWAVTGSWALDPNSAAGDRLTINGSYTAGSDIILDAFVFKTGSASDVVTINGDVAGVTTLWVNNTNAFGSGALTGRGPTDGVLLVDVNNAQDPAVVGTAFVLGNTSGWNWADPIKFPEPEIQVGAFVYDLEQGGNDGKNFYLQSQLLDQVPAYTVMTSAIQQHFYAELGTLYQRMGELRHADTGPKANSSFFEFWLRAYGQDVEMNPKEGFDFDMTSKGFMVGGDYAIRNWVAPQSRLHIGGFAGYGWTKLDNIKGPVGESAGKTDGYTLGLYATYFDTAKKGRGLYADAVAKVNFLDSEYSSSTRDTKAKSDDFAWGASMEVGYGIGLGGGFIIQPQGQLSYMQTSKEKFKESKTPGIPLEMERDKGESLRGRVGVQLQNTWITSGGTQFSPYVIANVLHEFMGDNRTTVSGTEFRNDMGGTWYNAGAGFSVDFDNVGLYGHVEYNFGNRIEGLGAGLGVKVRLGGSSPVTAAAPAPAPAPALAPKKNFLVFFDFDRSNITTDAQRVIDEAASVAKTGNVARVQLTGHTDRSGSEQYNMALSLRRGEAVKQALIARGVPAASIFIIGRGETQPLVPTADGVREPQNRRVEILL